MTLDKFNENELTQKNTSGIKKLDTQSAASAVAVETQGSLEKTKSIPRIMTENESMIADLVAEAPKGLAEIAINKAPGINILDIPEECKPLHGKKYRFRWLANDKYLAGKLRTSIWVLCTRENSPYIKPTRFKTHGAIEQGGMLLAFTTKELADAKEAIASQKSADLVKHYTEVLPDQKNLEKGFYKPSSSGIGEDNEGGLEEGVDFGEPNTAPVQE